MAIAARGGKPRGPADETLRKARVCYDHLAGIGVDVDRLAELRRPLCRTCLDWTFASRVSPARPAPRFPIAFSNSGGRVANREAARSPFHHMASARSERNSVRQDSAT